MTTLSESAAAAAAVIPLSLGVTTAPPVVLDAPTFRQVRPVASLASSTLGQWLDCQLLELKAGIRAKLQSVEAVEGAGELTHWSDFEGDRGLSDPPDLKLVKIAPIEDRDHAAFSLTGTDFDVWEL